MTRVLVVDIKLRDPHIDEKIGRVHVDVMLPTGKMHMTSDMVMKLPPSVRSEDFITCDEHIWPCLFNKHTKHFEMSLIVIYAKLLSTADTVYFCKGWDETNLGRVIHNIVQDIKIVDIIYEKPVSDVSVDLERDHIAYHVHGVDLEQHPVHYLFE